MAALCLWREGRDRSPNALAAIWHVILNRLCDPAQRWPRTVPGVILQHAQFSSFLASDPNVTKFPLNDGGPDWKAWLKCCAAVTDPRSADLSNGATNYEDEPTDPWTSGRCGPRKTPKSSPRRLTASAFTGCKTGRQRRQRRALQGLFRLLVIVPRALDRLSIFYFPLQ